MGNDLRQRTLVVRRVEARIKGCLLDAAAQTLLQRPRLRHDNVVVILRTRHQVRVGDEADRVFIH